MSAGRPAPSWAGGASLRQAHPQARLGASGALQSLGGPCGVPLVPEPLPAATRPPFNPPGAFSQAVDHMQTIKVSAAKKGVPVPHVHSSTIRSSADTGTARAPCMRRGPHSASKGPSAIGNNRAGP